MGCAGERVWSGNTGDGCMILKEGNYIILNRPEKKNAMNHALVEAFLKALDEEELSPSNYIIIKGAGSTFCSGADLNEDLEQLFPQIKKLFLRIKSFPKPIISYVEGYCLAGGMGLIAASDLVYAHPHAQFGLPEVKKDIVPAMVYGLLKSVLNPRHLNELAFVGDFIDAKRAYEMGLINHVGDVPELIDTETLRKIKALILK